MLGTDPFNYQAVSVADVSGGIDDAIAEAQVLVDQVASLAAGAHTFENTMLGLEQVDDVLGQASGRYGFLSQVSDDAVDPGGRARSGREGWTPSRRASASMRGSTGLSWASRPPPEASRWMASRRVSSSARCATSVVTGWNSRRASGMPCRRSRNVSLAWASSSGATSMNTTMPSSSPVTAWPVCRTPSSTICTARKLMARRATASRSTIRNCFRSSNRPRTRCCVRSFFARTTTRLRRSTWSCWRRRSASGTRRPAL